MKALLFITTILSPVYIYLGLRLSSHWSHWLVLAMIFFMIMSFPFKKFSRYQLHLIYFGMGFLTYLTVFSVVRDLIWLATDHLAPISHVFIMTGLSLVLGFINATKGPKVRHISVSINDLTEELEGFKIAQISDLHIGATIRRPYVEKVVKKVNALKSDLIALTGDIGDGPVQQFRQDIAPLAKLKSRYGSFFVPGNHEYYWNANEWLGIMNNLGIINLVNRGKIVEHGHSKVLIAGIPDPASRLLPDLDGVQDSESGENAEFKILLSHRPGIAHLASQKGFHLQLSGHTHGGQFFPWTIVVKFVHRLSKGLHRVGNMWLYVNPGTGSWGPLLRLGTTPEITLVELTRSQEFKIISE